MNKIILTIAVASLIVSGLIGTKVLKLTPQQIPDYRNYIDDQIDEYLSRLGGTSVQPYAGMTYTLSGAGVSSSATSIILSSLTIPQTTQKIVDSDLGDTFYLTIEPGNRSRQEIVSCTTVTQNSNGTATLSGCSRGLAPITPFTASTSLRFAHGGSSNIIFSDPPQLFNEYSALANDEAITGLWNFNTVLPTSDITATSSEQFTTYAYVNNVALQGAATSTESTGGIVELATQDEMASSTDLGADQPLVAQAKYATSTKPSPIGKYLPVTLSTGLLSQTFLNLAESFTFSSTVSFTTGTTTLGAGVDITNSSLATSPFRIRSLDYLWPSTAGASSSVMSTDGSGGLTFQEPEWSIIGESVLAAPTATVTISSLPARRDLRVVVHGIKSAAGLTSMTFNNDGAGNYSKTMSEDFGAAATETSKGAISMGIVGGAVNEYLVIEVGNSPNQVKMIQFSNLMSDGSAGTAVNFFDGGGIWEDTSNYINRIDIGAGSPSSITWNANTRITVWGSNR